MRQSIIRKGVAARPWWLVGGSLAAIAGLVLLLWRPERDTQPEGELVLFCAAGVLKPVQAIAAQYEAEYGTKVRIEPGGSGTLLSKLRVTPSAADLYLAAEESYVREARSLGLVAEILPVARQHVGDRREAGQPAEDRRRRRLAAERRGGRDSRIRNWRRWGRAASGRWAGPGQWDRLVRARRGSPRPRSRWWAR